MKTWTTGGKSLAEAKIQRGIFQGDALSPLLFVIVMMLLSHILRKYAAGYKLSKLQEKLNHLMYMDDIKLFCKKRKRNGNSKTSNKNIQSGYRDGIWHGKIRHANNEKREMTNDGGGLNYQIKTNLER